MLGWHFASLILRELFRIIVIGMVRLNLGGISVLLCPSFTLLSYVSTSTDEVHHFGNRHGNIGCGLYIYIKGTWLVPFTEKY